MKKITVNDTVSIIIPTYNCEEFISKTLDSVILQTYKNWEAIIVDDCSTDLTLDIVKKYAKMDSRIKYFTLIKNSGAAFARNKAVEVSKGSYIAFLDSDDLWHKSKLTKQLEFMKSNSYSFTCTSYDKIDDNDKSLNKIIYWNEISDYSGILKRNPGNSTVMYHSESLGKIKVPDIRKRNDYLMWLQVIKKAEKLYSLNEVLASHRIREGSLSRNKFDLVKYHWRVYREHEDIGYIKSLYLILYWSIITVFKMR